MKQVKLVLLMLFLVFVGSIACGEFDEPEPAPYPPNSSSKKAAGASCTEDDQCQSDDCYKRCFDVFNCETQGKCK